MHAWTNPAIEWQTALDGLAIEKQLAQTGELLTTWPAMPSEEFPTDCYRAGDDYWIWQPRVGGIRFAADCPRFTAFAVDHIDRNWFEDLVTQSWLPAIYQIWGRQVLHASGIVTAGGDAVVAFTGPSCAGKSTTAYGLARRPAWQMVTDDSLAFSIDHDTPGPDGIHVHPLRNRSRLRTATAAYYGKSGFVELPIEWPQRPLKLGAICVLNGDRSLKEPAAIQPLTMSESYVLLLEQANALTLEIPKYNQQLMQDYLTLAATIPVVRLTYRQSFEDVEAVYDAISDHLIAMNLAPSVDHGRPALQLAGVA